MSNSAILDIYSQPTQIGGDLPYFVGKQYGSGWLGTLAKVAFPILKRIAGVASNVAQDVIYDEKPIKSAIADRAMETVGQIINKNDDHSQTSSINRGVKRKRPISKPSKYPLFQKPNKPKRRRR